jgi:MFS transporter, SP family, general alpha glucoside:H+ symporter
MLKYAIGSFLSAIALNVVTQDRPEKWRNAVLSQFAFCGVAIVAWCFLPESPRWHCMHGQEGQAKNILRNIYKGVEDYDVDVEYRKMNMEIQTTSEKKEAQQGGTYLEVFQGTNLVSKYRNILQLQYFNQQSQRRLFISFLPWHWQVAIGVPIIGTYSSYFYQMAGLQNPFLGTVATKYALLCE